MQDGFSANGRVFKWVAPDTINGSLVLKGDHEPVRVLVSPKRQQTLALGVDHKFREETEISVEGAWSNYDINTFRDITHYGTYEVIVFRVNAEYVALYEDNSDGAGSLNEIITNVKNGFGIFTGLNSKKVYFEVKKL